MSFASPALAKEKTRSCGTNCTVTIVKDKHGKKVSEVKTKKDRRGRVTTERFEYNRHGGKKKVSEVKTKKDRRGRVTTERFEYNRHGGKKKVSEERGTGLHTGPAISAPPEPPAFGTEEYARQNREKLEGLKRAVARGDLTPEKAADLAAAGRGIYRMSRSDLKRYFKHETQPVKNRFDPTNRPVYPPKPPITRLPESPTCPVPKIKKSRKTPSSRDRPGRELRVPGRQPHLETGYRDRIDRFDRNMDRLRPDSGKKGSNAGKAFGKAVRGDIADKKAKGGFTLDYMGKDDKDDKDKGKKK